MSSFKQFLNKRVAEPFLNYMKQGMSPSKLALTISLGVAIGASPVVWTPTIMCVLVCLVLRLNLAAIQLTNYVTYPLHIICMIPFFKMGAFLFGDAAFNFSVQEIINMAKDDIGLTFSILGWSMLHAFVAWAITAPFMVGIMYVILLPILRKVASKFVMNVVPAAGKSPVI